MSSDARTILTTLRDKLRGVDGSGSYNYDLSGTDRVQLGEPGDMPLENGRIWLFGVERNDEDTGVTLGYHERSMTVMFAAFVTGGTAEDRLLNALDIGEDIHRALENDRTQALNVIRTIVRGATLDGESLGVEGFGVYSGRIEAMWHEKAPPG